MMQTLVEKERRRRLDIEARALAFSVAQKSASYIRYLHKSNADLEQHNRRMRSENSQLRAVLGSEYKDTLKKQAAVQFTKNIIEKFKETAAEIFDAESIEDMARIAEVCLDRDPARMTMPAYECFNRILDLVEVDVELQGPTLGSIPPEVSEMRYTVHVFWPKSAQFALNQAAPIGPRKSLKEIEAEYEAAGL